MEHLHGCPSFCLSLVLLLVTGVLTEVTRDLNCWYDTFATLSCSWSHNTSYTDAACILKANVLNDAPHGSCKPTANGVDSSSCQLFLDKNRKEPVLTVGHRIHLLLKCTSGNQSHLVENPSFKPYDNIQLNPPHSLRFINLSDARVNLTWTCENYVYVKGRRIYQVRYRPVGAFWKNMDIIQDQMWVEMPALGHDKHYEVQVRVHQKRFPGRWSDWSNLLEWRTPPAGLNLGNLLFLGGMCTAGVLISVALLTFVCRKTYWFKRFFCPSVPGPSKFFEPLLTLHGSERKLWFSSPFPPSSFTHVVAASKISPVEVVTKKDPNQVLLSVFPCLTTPSENSGHSQCSFHNLGYFQCPGSFERDPCHVYFTDEPLDNAESAILNDTSYQALSSADASLLCDLRYHRPPAIEKAIYCIQNEPFGLTSNPQAQEEQSCLLLSQTPHAVECEKAKDSLPFRSASESKASTQDQANDETLPKMDSRLDTSHTAISQGSGDAGVLFPPIYANTIGHAYAQRLGRDTDEYLSMEDLQLQYVSNMTVVGVC